MNNTISHPCTVCSRPTSLWCSRCQSAWYCSSEHIHTDWPSHRKECVPPNGQKSHNVNTIATPPPAEPLTLAVSALLFESTEERPRIITVSCRPSQKAFHGNSPIPILSPYFEEEPLSIVLMQGLNGEALRFPLHVWYSPTMLADGRPINRAIVHITCGAAEKPWAGPVVVLKYNGSRRQGYTDASANDLPALSAYFLSYK